MYQLFKLINYCYSQVMGLNPPFGVKASLANQFINKALTFKPKLMANFKLEREDTNTNMKRVSVRSRDLRIEFDGGH